MCKVFRKMRLLPVLLAVIFVLGACGGGSGLVGTWERIPDGRALEFNRDGTVTGLIAPPLLAGRPLPEYFVVNWHVEHDIVIVTQDYARWSDGHTHEGPQRRLEFEINDGILEIWSTGGGRSDRYVRAR